MIDFIASLGPHILYPTIFVGLIFLGGLVLLPSLYLSLFGSVNLALLFMTAILAGVAADSLWYTMGRVSKKEKLYSFAFVKKRIDEANLFSSFFSKHGVLLVFLTKFIYGTRIASHVLAGMHKITYAYFALATMAGTAIWFFLFYFLIKSLDAGLSQAGDMAFRIQLVCLILFIIILIINWFTGKYLRKRFMKGKSRLPSIVP